MECDEEWAMNKKIVDLSSRDIRQAVRPLFHFLFHLCFTLLSCDMNSDVDVLFLLQVPRGLPYFAVDFGLQGGFAHVIENEQKFPHYFGKVSRCC